MMVHRVKKCGLMIVFLVFGINLFAATTPASTSVSALSAIATAAQNIGQLPNDRGSYMTNYIKNHLASAATRLSTVCNMTSNTFSGNQSDQGVILGISNNTSSDFIIQQDGQNIGQVVPGWNGDIVLNLAALSSSGSTTSSLPSFIFIPANGASISKLIVRVMTGQQLLTHVTNEQTKAATSTSTVTFFKNGINALPTAADEAAVSSDLYLVVENAALVSGTPLSSAAKRIQALNISNITNLYTVSLSISSMGLVSINNQVLQEASLSSTYAMAISSVHILNEINGHTVPLLMMPRSVYMAGSAINALYAPYIQQYANYLGGKYAGTAPVYYDLSILYPHEPFEYLRLLKYFDLHASSLAVVDKNVAMSSGTVVGSFILTDVYGAYIEDVSSDLSWVACNATGFDTTNNDPILLACVSPIDAKMNGAPMKVSNWYEQVLQTITPFDTKIYPSKSESTSGFPISHAGAYLMHTLSINPGHFQGCLNVHINASAGGQFTENVLNTGDPKNVTSGQSYNYVGSMPSGWWTISMPTLRVGINIVPVFYNVGTCVPFVSTQESQLVNSTNQSALYYYSYDSLTGQSLGLVPVLGNGAVATYSFASDNAWFGLCGNGVQQIPSSFKAPGYATAVTSHPFNLSNLTAESGSYVDYPGYSTLGMMPNVYMIRNTFANMLPLRKVIQEQWSVKNALAGVCAMSVPLTDIEVSQQNTNNGILIQVTPVSTNTYELVMFDTQNNVLGFQQIYAPDNAMQLAACRMSDQGIAQSVSQAVMLPSTVGYFKLTDVPGVGLQLVATAAPVSTNVATAGATQSPAQPAYSNKDKRLIVRYKQLQKEISGMLEFMQRLKMRFLQQAIMIANVPNAPQFPAMPVLSQAPAVLPVKYSELRQAYKDLYAQSQTVKNQINLAQQALDQQNQMIAQYAY